MIEKYCGDDWMSLADEVIIHPERKSFFFLKSENKKFTGNGISNHFSNFSSFKTELTQASGSDQHFLTA